MNITESNDLNTVLQHLIPGTPARSGGRPDSEQAQAAAVRLADKAKKALVAGLGGSDVAAAWSGLDDAAPPGPLQVLVEELAPHPDNVRHDIGDVTELALSIQARGVLSPLTVATMDAWVEANPALADQVEIGRYVVIAGHRRLKAANQAELETVPVIVRDDLAGEAPTVGTMLDENLHREGLSVLEEARALERLRNAHTPRLTERQLATLRHVSPSHVHKRLSLLKLPEQIQGQLVPAGELCVVDALELLRLPNADEIADAWKRAKEDGHRIQDVVAWRLGALEHEKRATEARATLQKAGIEVVADIRQVLGPRWWEHQHPGGGDIDQVTNPADTIAVVGSQGGVQLYSRTIPIDADHVDVVEDQPDDDTAATASTGSTSAYQAEQDRAARAKEREADLAAGHEADRARAAACRWLVTEGATDGVLTAELAAEILADFVLVNAALEEYGPATTAAGWLGFDLNPDDILDENDVEERWVDEQGDAGGRAALHAAVGTALADLEKSLPSVRQPGDQLATWSTRQIRHVRRLVEHADHELSEIEQRVIAHSEAKHAAASAAAEQGGDDDDD